MSIPCTDGAHRHPHPDPLSSVESSNKLLVNCGPDDDPEWFTCCEVWRIQERRTAA